MERYSELYGTLAGNGSIYSPVKTNPNLPKFMNDVGAVNPTATGDAVRNILSGFDSACFGDHYLSQPVDDLPVAVRYAPMHLYKRADMPSSMAPFCALSVTGNENKHDTGDNRVTYYSHTFYITRALMHEAGEYNYLDQIFGTHLLSHEEVAAIRAGKAALEAYEQPAKVDPQMQPQDAAAVLNTVCAVFDEKAVVIRLEKGCDFNRRAWSLLIPIYALMPPRLAAEIGFATYQDPKGISALITETSVRIFVVPAECKLEDISGGNTLILDMNAPATIPSLKNVDEGFRKALAGWQNMPWQRRQVAMEKLFADTEATFNDKNIFVQRSLEFLADPLVKGGKEIPDRRTVTSLEELEAKLNANPLYRQIPWLLERAKIWLSKDVKLSKLTVEALYQALYNEDAQIRQRNLQLYRLGIEMEALTPDAAANYIGAAASHVGKRWEEALEVKHNAALAALAAKHKVDTDALKQKITQVEQEAEARCAAAVEEEKKQHELTRQALAAEQENTARVKAEGEAALAAAVAAEQEKTEQVKKVAAEKIKAERDAHDATKQALTAEQEQHQATRQTLSAEQTAHQADQEQLSEATQRLEKAKIAYTQLKKECDEYKGQIDGAKAEAAQAIRDAKRREAEATQAKADLDAAKADLDKAMAKAEKTIKENNKRMVIFAAAGFLVASLIFGVILLVMGLSVGEEPAETSAPTDVQVQTDTQPSEEATEPTEESTEAPTEESTVAPTEAAVEPDLSDWTNDAAALWLTEQIDGIDSIVLEPTSVPEELASVEGYTPVAQILMAGEDADTENYAVLLQNTGADVDRKPVDDPLAEGTEPAETEESTEPAEGGDLTADAAELTAIEVEGARLVLTAQDFVLVVYGGDDAVATAVELFAAIVAEDEQVLTSWTLADTAWDLDAMMQELLSDEAWWRSVNAVSTDETALTEVQAALELEDMPVLCLTCGEKEVIFFQKTTSVGAKSLTDELLDAGYQAAVADTLVAVIHSV